MLEDISLRRKQAKLGEKKKDIEFAVAKRLNKIFKQFIYRFQNEIEIYFEYIKFCSSVGFNEAISGIIGQMLQVNIAHLFISVLLTFNWTIYQISTIILSMILLPNQPD